MTVKQVLIGGGTGFIGKRLVAVLQSSGYETIVVSRNPAGDKRITWHELEKNGIPPGTTACVNLAGQNVLDPTRRWTPGFQQNVWNSRINTTTTMAKAIDKTADKPKVFISMCGASGYQPDPNKTYTEADDIKAFDYMSKLCVGWEKAAILSDNSLCRLVKLRTGVVFGREGGMIKSLILPFYFGLGGPIGNGKQYLPWIHITDLCNFIKYSIENENVKGVYNGVAPEITTNLGFTKAFAEALFRPALIPLPEFVVNIIFGRERAVLLNTGPKVAPENVLASGFKYTYPDIKSACKEVGKLF